MVKHSFENALIGRNFDVLVRPAKLHVYGSCVSRKSYYEAFEANPPGVDFQYRGNIEDRINQRFGSADIDEGLSRNGA